MFPHQPCSPSSPGVGVQLRTTDGSPIPGTCNIAFQFGSRWFDWNFLLADVSVHILGSNFLQHFHLLVDVTGSCLLEATTLEPLLAVSSSSSNSKSHLYAALISTPQEFRDLLAEYPDVVSAKFQFF